MMLRCKQEIQSNPSSSDYDAYILHNRVAQRLDGNVDSQLFALPHRNHYLFTPHPSQIKRLSAKGPVDL